VLFRSAFECELKPINENSIPEAMKVTGMSLDELTKTGLEPSEAMVRFADWIATVVSSKQHPVFVGLNAPFDWSFINYYFHKYHSENPFGFTALDIKAFYFGKFGGVWGDAKSSAMSAHLKPKLTGDHTALADARYQAELFRLMQEYDSIGD